MLGAQKARLNLRRNRFSYMIETTWNSLPSSAVECDSLNTFKNRIDEHCKQLDFCYTANFNCVYGLIEYIFRVFFIYMYFFSSNNCIYF